MQAPVAGLGINLVSPWGPWKGRGNELNWLPVLAGDAKWQLDRFSRNCGLNLAKYIHFKWPADTVAGTVFQVAADEQSVLPCPPRDGRLE